MYLNFLPICSSLTPSHFCQLYYNCYIVSFYNIYFLFYNDYFYRFYLKFQILMLPVLDLRPFMPWLLHFLGTLFYFTVWDYWIFMLSTFLEEGLMSAIFIAEILYMFGLRLKPFPSFIKGSFSSVSSFFPHYFVKHFIEESRAEILLICHLLSEGSWNTASYWSAYSLKR